MDDEKHTCPECRNEMTRCAYGERWGEPYHCHVCNWAGAQPPQEEKQC